VPFRSGTRFVVSFIFKKQARTLSQRMRAQTTTCIRTKPIEGVAMATKYTSRIHLALVLSCVIVVIAGCAMNADIRSNKGDDNPHEIKKLFVISQVGIVLGEEFASTFRNQFTSVVHDCGIGVEISTVDPLELDKNIHTTRMKKYDPDTVMLIERTGGTKSGTSYTQVIYEVKLYDVKTEKKFWNARVSIYPVVGLIPRGGDGLATDLINSLKADGIFRSCPEIKEK
jgi:hypothetical protein